MIPVKSIVRATLIVVMMLGALTLAARPADASSSGPICEQGVLTATGQCEIETDPVAGDTCPAIEEAGQCFQLVPAVDVCEIGTVVGDGTCRVSAPDTVELSCPPPLEPDGGDGCVDFVAAEQVTQCDAGDLIAGNCYVPLGPPDPQLSCPNLGSVADGCYRTDSVRFTCDEGTLSGAFCIVEVEPIAGDPECPPGQDTLVDFGGPGIDHCGITTIVDWQCADVDGFFGEYNGNEECRAAYFVPSGCELFVDLIELYDFVEPDSGGCYGFFFDGPTPINGFCPNGLTAISESICAEYLGPAATCLSPFSLDPENEDQCEIIYPAGVTCPGDFPEFLGVADDEPYCVQDLGPAPASSTCPPGAVDDGGCFVQVPAEDDCDGVLNDALECEVAEDPVDDGPICLEGELIGANCYENAGSPTTSFVCNVGVPLGNSCVVPADPVETVTCGDAMGVPGDCFEIEDAATECPAGSLAGAEFPVDCREAVDRTGEGCPDGYDDIAGRCVRYAEPLWYCDDVLVTINMMLGDSGFGTGGNDVILGTNGNDYIRGEGGADIICAGAGDDFVYGNLGDDTIFGEDGDDRIDGGFHDDYVDGGDGDDTLWGNDGDDHLFGSYGDDGLYGHAGDDLLRGGFGDDRLIGSFGDDVIRGGLGDDFIYGGMGIDDCRQGPGSGPVRTCEAAAVG